MPIGPIEPIQNGESGASVRAKLNLLLQGAVDGTLGSVTPEDLDNLVDTIAPAAPEDFVLTSTLVPSAELVATWHPSLEDDFAYYELQLREAGGDWIGYQTSATLHRVPMVPNTTYTGRVYAIDRSGNKSAPSAEFTHTTVVDEIPPAMPIDVRADGGFGTVWLQWLPNTESDLARYEIYEASSEFPVPDTDSLASFTSLTAAFVRSGLPDGVTRYYWVRAIDTSGNKSPWSEVKSAYTTTLDGTAPPAEVPTGLTLTSETVTDAQGNVTARILATWDEATDAKLYSIGIIEAGANERYATSPTNSFQFVGLPGITYQVRVCSLNALNRPSAFTSYKSVTATGDTTPPAVPSITTATGGFNLAWLEWTTNSENDFSHYELYQSLSTTAPVAATVPTYRTPATALAINDVTGPATVYFWIRAVDTSGNKSAWSARSNVAVLDLSGTQPVAPAPSGLAATSSLVASGNSFIAKVRVTWNAVGAAASYEVSVTRSGATASLLAASANSLEFDGLPGVTYTISVKAINAAGVKGAATTAITHTPAGDTTAPAVPGSPVATGGFGVVWLKWTKNTESDFSFYEIYESASTTAPGAATAATYTSVSETFVREGLTGPTTRHYWIRAVDTSGNKSTWSARVQANILDLNGTTAAPAVPENLAAASTVQIDAQGNVRAKITVTWTASSGATLYDISVQRAGASESVLTTGATSVEFDGLPGIAYTIKVRALNGLNDKSGYTTAISHTPTGDTTAPAVPASLTATGGFGVVWLKWPKNSESDFSFYEIYESASTTAPGAATAATYTSVSETFVRQGLSGVVTRHYWIRAVDTSSNKSAWSSRAQATTIDVDTTVTTEDLQGLVDATSFASSIAVPGLGATLPATPFTDETPKTFYRTTDGLIYKQKADGSGWEPTTSAALIVGQLEAGQIAAGAIGTTQLAAKAVTVDKMIVQSSDNLVPDNAFDGQSWQLSDGATFGVTNIAGGKKGVIYTEPASDPTGYTLAASSRVFPVAAGQNYRISYSTYSTATHYVWGRIDYLDANFSSLNLYSPGASGNFPAGENEWSTNHVVPAGALYARFQFYVQRTVAAANQVIEVSEPRVTLRNAAQLIVDGSLTASMITTGEFITLSAQIKDAIVTDAKIANLSAAKLTAGTALAGSITVSGTALSTIGSNAALGAQDPATRINAASTTIDPGKIVISGATTLADWRGSSDTTTINGGKIETTSISVHSLSVGDFENLMPNGDFYDIKRTPSEYFVIGGFAGLAWDTAIANRQTGNASLKLSRSTGSNSSCTVQASLDIPVKPGDVLSLEMVSKVDVASSAGLYFRLNWFAADKTAVAPVTDVVSNGATATTWTTHSGKVTVPATAGWLRIQVWQNVNNTTSTVWWIDRIIIRKAAGSLQIANGAISGAHLITTENVITLSAQIKDAIVTDAKIANLSAAKLTAGTALAGSITVSGTALSTIGSNAALGAQDPATRINAASTTIDPGKIVISGVTTLADWRGSSDTTTINGGKIEANSVTAKTLMVQDHENLIHNGQFEDGANPYDYWTIDTSIGNTLSYSTDALKGARMLVHTKRAAPYSDGGTAHRKNIPVVAGETLYFETAMKGPVASGNGGYFRLVWLDKNGANFSPVRYSDVVGNVPISTSWVEYSGKVTVPADACFVNVRLYNTSTVEGANVIYRDRLILRRANAAQLIVDGSLTASMITTGEFITLSAQIKDAIVTDAKIANLSAAKLTAGTAMAGSITVSGTALSTIGSNAALGAQDPATRINAASTKIDPGRITISGASTLADWRGSSDTTTINGGKIEANSVKANSLEIGARGITTAGIAFSGNSPSSNRVSWTAGTVTYVNDAGATQTVSIDANVTGVAWTDSIIYIYWAKGATSLSSTTSPATAFASNNIVLATYNGGLNLATDYGRTIIDGQGIKTGSIGTEQLAAGSVRAETLAADSVTAAKLGAGAVTAEKLAAGAVTADKMSVTSLSAISANLGNVDIGDANISRLRVGQSNILQGAVTRYDATAGDGDASSNWTTVLAMVSWHGQGSPLIEILFSGAVGISNANLYAQYRIVIEQTGQELRYRSVAGGKGPSETTPSTEVILYQPDSWRDGTTILFQLRSNSTSGAAGLRGGYMRTLVLKNG